MLKYKLILSILLFAVVSAKSYAERIITLRVNDSYAPFEYLNKDGKPIGFSIEIFNALNNINKFEYTTQANKGIFNFHSTTLDSTDIATSMDSVPHNSNFITSHPFGYIDNDIVVRVFSEIHSLNDLDGKTVLIVKNSPMILYIKQRNIKVDFVFIKNVPDGLRLLSSGKYDAMITSNDAAYFYINKHNLQNLSVRRLFCQPLSIKFVMLNTAQNQITINKINNSLRTIRANGTYDQIYFKRFYPINEDSLQPLELTFLIIGVAIAMILIFYILYVHWLYQAEKKKKSSAIIDDTPLITNMQKIYDSIPTVTVYFDDSGRIKFINKAGYELVNASRRSRLHLDAHSIFEHTILNDEMIDNLQNNQAINFTYNLISKDSIFNHLGDFVLPKDKLYNIFIIPLSNYGTALSGYITYIYDITELHYLKHKNLQYLTSLSQISDKQLLDICYYDNDDNRFYSFANNTAHDTGVSYEQALTYIHPLSRSLFIEEFLSILNGEKRTAQITIKRIFGKENKYESRDITLNAIRVDSNTTIGISIASSPTETNDISISKYTALHDRFDLMLKSTECQFFEYNPITQIFNITTTDNSHRIFNTTQMIEAIHPYDRGKYSEILHDFTTNHRETAYLVLRIKTGLSNKYHYYGVNMYSYYDNNISANIIIGIYSNISNNIYQLRELEEFKETAIQLCEANSIGFFEYTPLENEHYFIPCYFDENYGINDDNFMSLFDADSKEKFDSLLVQFDSKSSHIDNISLRIQSPNNECWITIELTIAPIYDDTTQEVSKYIGIIKEITA